MFTAFFIGNIGSGKSVATRYLEQLGARRIDLDELAKGLYVPGSALVEAIAQAFGSDIVDADGELRRALLAERAFSSPEATGLLNSLVYPALLDELGRMLLPSPCSPAGAQAPSLTIVEISNAVAFTSSFGLADEIVCIDAPLELRRQRALGRGMQVADFEARVAVQPSDGDLRSLADTVLSNEGTAEELRSLLDAWLDARRLLGQEPVCGGDGSRG